MAQCVLCFEGEPEVGRTSLVYTRPGSTIQVRVEGIPVEICPVCGEIYLTEAVAQRIYDLVSTKAIDPLPDSFDTEYTAGEFWDTHSTMDYIEYLEPADDVFDIQERVFE